MKEADSQAEREEQSAQVETAKCRQHSGPDKQGARNSGWGCQLSQGAFCCFPKCALAGSWNQERSWDYKQSTPTWDINVSNSSLTAKPSTHPNTNS